MEQESHESRMKSALLLALASLPEDLTLDEKDKVNPKVSQTDGYAHESARMKLTFTFISSACVEMQVHLFSFSIGPRWSNWQVVNSSHKTFNPLPLQQHELLAA